MNGQGYLRAAARLAESEGFDQWTALMHVFLPRLREIEWPPELQQALEVAERHWAGEPQDLEGARVEVWNFIRRTFPLRDEVAFPEGRAARGLLGVFWPDGTLEEESSYAEWFAAMIDNETEWATDA
jgi:hypothetical protein